MSLLIQECHLWFVYIFWNMYHRQPSNHPTLLKQNQIQNQCPFNFLFPLFKRKKTLTNCLKLELRRYPFFQNLFPMTIYPTSKIDTGSSCWISSSSVVNQVTINTVYIAGIIEGKNELDFTKNISLKFVSSSTHPLLHLMPDIPLERRNLLR